MRDEVRKGQIGFKVFGPSEASDTNVDAEVFARKLRAFIKALKAADKAVNNGKNAHTYRIEKLHTSIPTGIIEEAQISDSFIVSESGVETLIECAEMVKVGDPRALKFGDCTKFLVELSRSNKEFGYVEAWTHDKRHLRADKFLRDRAKEILEPNSKSSQAETKWFKGVSIGSFDGTLQLIDNRGIQPLLKIVLSAGNHEIDCLCTREHLAKASNLFSKRVNVTGRAIYDGTSGLPARIEVIDFDAVKEYPDFLSWKGKFSPFTTSDWDAEQ